VIAPTKSVSNAFPALVGMEWIVEALDCDPVRLRDCDALEDICEKLLQELDLHAIGEGRWHQFPPPGGVTGLYLLTESHLACHTYPEHALATFNLYCCRPRTRWEWEKHLGEALKASRVLVRSLERGMILPFPRWGEGDSQREPGEGLIVESPSAGPVLKDLPTFSPAGRGLDSTEARP
jgi:S-adenosylmethionine decarboxylase